METRPADIESGYVFHHANTSLRRATDDGRRAGGGLSSSAVGKRTDMYPKDAGKLILPDDEIHFSMHLFPIGREVVDAQIQVGVWLYPEGEEPKYTTNDETSFNSGESRSLGLPRYTDLLIPPYGYQLMRGNFVLERNARVHSIRGHMHLRGGYQMMEAIYPDGRAGGDQQDRLEPSVAHDAHLRGFSAAPVAEGHAYRRHLPVGQYGGQSHPTPTLTSGWSTTAAA